ncbi:MAG TPA: hypothetical protein VGS19_18175 [Streptosporangiaceae bacterium]|nr:hypothetical protein [Streptosporangiaceae bacterium]
MSVMKNRCQVCGVRPPAMREIPFCFECWPGGPVTPPPCRRCGSAENYFTSGLCTHCHFHAPGPKSPVWESPGKLRRRPVVVSSCPDCGAWGVTARYGWICAACKAWREKYGRPASCPTCGQQAPLGPAGSCRLCCKQRHHAARLLGRRIETVSLAEANAHGQQLFIAGMWRPPGTPRRDYQKKTVPADMSLLRPVPWRQLVLTETPRNLRLGITKGFPPPPDPALAAAFAQFVRGHAQQVGWSTNRTALIQRSTRIMLGIQDTPGAPIRRSDILLLTQIRHPAAAVAEVIAAAGMLEDDRQPAVLRWFEVTVAPLPAPMRHELRTWLATMRDGRTTPPRRKPRSDQTIRNHLGFALPALKTWAAIHASLREISRAEVLAVLPPSGAPRATTVQGLRSIFRALKAAKIVFSDPTFRIHVPAAQFKIPPAVELATLRGALNSPRPAQAAIAALLGFHATRVGHLCTLQLTDTRDGRIHIGEQVILLAAPARERLGAYLSYRTATWPASINPHLFIHARNWASTRPVTSAWIGNQLGMSAQHIRLDRILDEAHATHGDVRALCDLFGMSVSNAARYATAIDRITGPHGAATGP